MADFLEERISADILTGASFQDDYSVEIVGDSSSVEYRAMRHPFPVRRFDISYLLERQEMWEELLNLYHRAHGKYAGFRIRCHDDWKSCSPSGTITAFDQTAGFVSTGVYELRKYYGTDGTAGASGYPYRKIKKPVSGTVKFGIGGREIRSADWSVDTTTGIITNAADSSFAITGISKAAQAVLTFASYSIQVGESFHISSVSGMTQINGLRGTVVSKIGSTITLDIDSTAFSTYTSGGVIHRAPQSGEVVTAGFEFDVPVRFNTNIPVGQDFTYWRSLDGIELVELLNP